MVPEELRERVPTLASHTQAFMRADSRSVRQRPRADICVEVSTDDGLREAAQADIVQGRLPERFFFPASLRRQMHAGNYEGDVVAIAVDEEAAAAGLVVYPQLPEVPSTPDRRLALTLQSGEKMK